MPGQLADETLRRAEEALDALYRQHPELLDMIILGRWAQPEPTGPCPPEPTGPYEPPGLPVPGK